MKRTPFAFNTDAPLQQLPFATNLDLPSCEHEPVLLLFVFLISPDFDFISLSIFIAPTLQQIPSVRDRFSAHSTLTAPGKKKGGKRGAKEVAWNDGPIEVDDAIDVTATCHS